VSELHVEMTGRGGPTVVLVHGFTQTAVSWRPVVERLAADHRVVCVDAPGHGGSAAVRADLVQGAAMLARVAPGAVHVGYSMGARLVLQLAVDHPEVAAGVVLIGGTAGIDDDDERAARRAADEASARALEADGTRAFIDRWVAQPLFGPRRPAADDLAARYRQDPEALASSLRLAGTATMDPPRWSRLAEVTAPALVAWGEHDAKFAALGARLVAGLGAEALEVPGAHHAAHLDRPDVVAAAIAGLRGRS
jgi:2-succinyl-6-hydroxy-2,4-cyclohexadiene-1-carboxylate synthase